MPIEVLSSKEVSQVACVPCLKSGRCTYLTLPMQVVPRVTEQFQPALSVVLRAGFLFVYGLSRKERSMTGDEMRQSFLNFFAEREHAIIPSAPLVPENDPTALFISAGMHPLVPYLLGESHPEGQR